MQTWQLQRKYGPCASQRTDHAILLRLRPSNGAFGDRPLVADLEHDGAGEPQDRRLLREDAHDTVRRGITFDRSKPFVDQDLPQSLTGKTLKAVTTSLASPSIAATTGKRDST